jgi:hypothetical protein
MRLAMRLTEAKNRDKDTKYRKCYVSAIKSSVPCNHDGEPSRRYVPREHHHPLDTAFPQVGNLIFEDMLDKSPEEPRRSKKKKTKEEHISAQPGSTDSPDVLRDIRAFYLKYAPLLDKDAPEVQTAQPVRKKVAPRSVMLNPRQRPAATQTAIRSVETIESPKRRKRPIVEEDEEYTDEEQDEEDDEDDRETAKRPTKRHKASIPAASTPNTGTKKKAKLVRRSPRSKGN